jgi:Peptidase family M1 domain
MNRGGSMLLAALLLGAGAEAAGQTPARAVRRTIPITRTFERGLAAGTRDSTGRPGPRYWQLGVDYRITARLDPAAGQVSGHASITIHNTSPASLDTIPIRLYQNRFTATGVRVRHPPSVTRGIQLTRIVANGGEVDGLERLEPSWAMPPLVRVPLAAPIPAGGTGTLEVEWTGEVPDVPPGRRGAARGGRRGSRVLQVAQWYPQVAKFDDLRGWDLEPHLGASEFYNNFGRFDVSLDVPAGWLVGATGTLQNPDEVLTPVVRQRLTHVLESDDQQTIVGPGDRGVGWATPGGDRLTWHFIADLVNDFAWAASPDYLWDATRATIPGRGTIPVNIFYLPEHESYRRTGAMARHALEFYSGLWFPYAFPQFTQVDGPEGGMEYPMLTMSGPNFGVTDHEIGHQWWPMMVGTNETWYGWMDEGFNDYMNILSEAAYRKVPAVLDTLGASYGETALTETQAPMMWDNNYGGGSTTFVTYDKAGMMFSMLGAIVGDSAVVRALRSYAQDWRFRHPSPWDFMFAMNRELKQDLGWFWYYWLFTTETSDGAIAGVEQKGNRTLVTVREGGEMPAPVVLRIEFAGDGPVPATRMGNAVIEGRTATVTWPAEVWFDGHRIFVAELSFGKARIERITLDPRLRFPDRDYADNIWPRPQAK